MSGNNLYCSTCKSHHHPAEDCDGDDCARAEIDRLKMVNKMNLDVIEERRQEIQDLLKITEEQNDTIIKAKAEIDRLKKVIDGLPDETELKKLIVKNINNSFNSGDLNYQTTLAKAINTRIQEGE